MIKFFFYTALLFILMWFCGLFYFIYGLSQSDLPSDENTDGIVVLTGGKSRLQEAAHLLEKGLAERLFISGVNATVTEEELFALLDIPEALEKCCVESGKAARNTVGNAEEISQWVARNGVSTIRVVTSLEHMPRTLVEMRHFMPRITMVAHPVGQWRPENIRFFSLAREYSKYLVSLFRTRILDI